MGLLTLFQGLLKKGPSSEDELRKSIEELSSRLDEVKKATDALAGKVDEVSKLVAELSKEVGKLGNSLGHIVEDVARSLLPSWLSANFGISVKELNRAYFELGDKLVEVDLYGEGVDQRGEHVVVLGEVKAKIHRDDVRAFHEKAQLILGGNSRCLLVMYGLHVHPTAVQEAAHRGVLLVSPYATLMQSTRVKLAKS